MYRPSLLAHLDLLSCAYRGSLAATRSTCSMVDLVDDLADVPHQCRADLPGEMRLAARVVREGVEDAERGRPEPDRVPGDRVRLLVDERQPALQELLDL